MALPLLWKPLGDWLLVISAITSRGPIVLMASALTLSLATAIELYCVRTRIEVMFDVLKNLLHAFCFRFWTKRLPRHPRRPQADRHLHAPVAAQLSTVEACWQAYETFGLGAVIAHGLFQLIALRFGALVWQHHPLYLRTQSRALPSEKTVKQVLAPRLLQQFVHLPAISILQKIQRCFDANPSDDDEKDRWAG